MTENTPITVYTANCMGNAKNCLYPNKIQITDDASARLAFSKDMVCAKYKNNYRSVNTFKYANALPGDCDNDHSDEPADWVTPEDIADLFADVSYVLHYSRHHMKPKGEKSARPRFHLVLLCKSETDVERYVALKKRLLAAFPFFDPKAMDAARFLFGTEDPEVIYHPGTITLNAFLDDWESAHAFAELDNIIPEGSRNSTMSRIGARIIKRYGDTTEARELFFRESEKCSPPLEDAELETIWGSCQKFFQKLCSTPGYIPPDAYNRTGPIQWETPIPFDEFTLPEFPIEALPPAIRNYVQAVSETTQTAIDMAAVASLAILSICLQGKYRIWGKPDWSEPLNTYCVIVLPPAERKSAVISLMTAPLEEYEKEKNDAMDVQIIESQMKKAVLEKERRMLEDRVSKGKADATALSDKAKEISAFHEVQPLKLFADDVTAEKLTSILAENHGKAAIVSAEGGIFDILNGIYTKNVNIDVFLKGHSGDTIRVDRIGRASESILRPALTMLLAVQPEVLNGLMRNGTFRGRGLTARFLYAIPKSALGVRNFYTKPIDESVKTEYIKLLRSLLETDAKEEPMELSREATAVLERLFRDIENRFHTDLAEIADWAGKYVGAVLRIAGLLHGVQHHGFLDFTEVSGQTMEDAVRIGEYFLEHAKAAYSLMGTDPVNKQGEYLLNTIQRNGLAEFSRRDAMRLCRGFKTAESIQPVLNRLCEYGYIATKPTEATAGPGRRPSEVYLTNPSLLAG